VIPFVLLECHFSHNTGFKNGARILAGLIYGVGIQQCDERLMVLCQQPPVIC
jgi:hypothetical protein